MLSIFCPVFVIFLIALPQYFNNIFAKDFRLRFLRRLEYGGPALSAEIWFCCTHTSSSKLTATTIASIDEEAIIITFSALRR